MRVGGEERLDLEQRERTRTLIAHGEHVWRSPHVLISHVGSCRACAFRIHIRLYRIMYYRSDVLAKAVKYYMYMCMYLRSGKD